MEKSTLYSIGHGNKSIDELIEELCFFNIKYLIDVRSKPYSKHHPQFNKDNLILELKGREIKYVYMGDLLGGLPDDESCYTNGYVDYQILKEKDFFKKGLERLINANNKKIKVAIMCSETNPSMCHRSKLIGEELLKHGIVLNHIIRLKETNQIILKDQYSVMSEIAPNGVLNLFGEEISFHSRKKYKNNNL